MHLKCCCYKIQLLRILINNYAKMMRMSEYKLKMKLKMEIDLPENIPTAIHSRNMRFDAESAPVNRSHGRLAVLRRLGGLNFNYIALGIRHRIASCLSNVN